ncbi:MAG: hypothetical protein PUB69_03805 [Desulfovibrionaceae bacterium]|nr:hypothetical protein [Desulfovibrionaceae bacterium]
MTIDKEYIRKILNQYADVAIEVNAIKQELIKEKDIENDDKLSWEEQHTIKTFLNFGMTRLLDEYLPKEQL